MSFFSKENWANSWPIAPGETEAQFVERIKAVKELYRNPPIQIAPFIDAVSWEKIIKKGEELFDICPTDILVFRKNKGLSWMEGGAMWLYLEEKKALPMIQLPRRKRRLSFATEEEILLHEAVHVARMGFKEPLFEEHLAYQTSYSKWRRWFGPLFLSSKESVLWVFSIFFLPFAEILSWIWDLPWLFVFSLGLFTIFSLFLFGRLFVLKWVLCKAFYRLKDLLPLSFNPWGVLVRMRDREIFLFAFTSNEKNRLWIRFQSEFRWESLRKRYFSYL